MDGIFIEPWLPPVPPDLARLAMIAADLAGTPSLRAWPEWRRGGVAFAGLPPFLPWLGQDGGGRHLVLLQVRELGALVPGARPADLPQDWLERLALEDLARPLEGHPDLAGRALQVVRVPGPGQAQVRAWGRAGEPVVGAILVRLSGQAGWRISTRIG